MRTNGDDTENNEFDFKIGKLVKLTIKRSWLAGLMAATIIVVTICVAIRAPIIAKVFGY